MIKRHTQDKATMLYSLTFYLLQSLTYVYITYFSGAFSTGLNRSLTRVQNKEKVISGQEDMVENPSCIKVRQTNVQYPTRCNTAANSVSVIWIDLVY